MTNLQQKESELFRLWSNKRNGFSQDGIISETEYIKSSPKIMLILKEVNNKKGEGVDMKDFLLHGAYDRKPTWDNVARWIYGLRNLDKNIEWETLDKKNCIKQIRKEVLPTICLINLKKSPGGHTSNHRNLNLIANQDKEFLKKQFDLYFENEVTRPEIIIGCGNTTSNIFNELVKIPNSGNYEMTSKGIYYYKYDDNNKIFIKYLHPEARVPDNLKYYGLIDAIKEIWNK